MPEQATTSVSDLIRALTATVRFTDRDSYPGLACVRIEAGSGTLVATGSNRYVAAHGRIKATGELPATFVPAEHISTVLGALNGVRDRDRITGNRTLVEVAVVDGAMRITADGATLTVPARRDVVWPDAVDAAFASGATRDNSALDGPITLDPKWLHQIHAVTDNVLEEPAVLSFGGPRGMIRVEVGDWFVAMVMPMRSLPSSKPVPFGVPAKVAP